MRRSLLAAALTIATLTISGNYVLAQQGLPPLKPPPPAPVKPYKPVAVTPPTPFSDPGFVAFRKQLADASAKKDRAALAKLVVAQGFFWEQDKDLSDPKKSGIDNLAKATALDAKDSPGWDVLTGFANEPTASESPEHKGVFCGPADPTIDPTAFEALSKSTGTDPSEWGYPTKPDVEAHASAQANSPVVGKLGMNLVRVLPDSGQGGDPNQPIMLHVALPDGKAGFVDGLAVAPLGGDQMCYSKDAAGWKIAGYFGGMTQ
ncbi:MAG TPA: hypothetical protein VH206_12545 [Xanthobacteraceae bacterium]|jgi:hypothetical protein|nr:hypothetical protein [Xanthobacteraceae bacterium]